MYELFRSVGQIQNVKRISSRSIVIEFVSTTNDQLNKATGKITLDGIKFTFRSKNIQVDARPYFEDKAKKELDRNEKWCNDELKVAPAEDSPQNIVNILDDDSLLQIFQEFDVNDLCSVANVCQRFMDLAKYTFKQKYAKHGRLQIRELCDKFGYYIPLFYVDLYLRTFGAEIRAFSCNNSNNALILRMCAEHCEKIETLHLEVRRWNVTFSNELRRLLPKLKELTLCLNRHARNTIGDLLADNWPLEVLVLGGNIDWRTTEIELPRLKKFKLLGNTQTLTEQALNQCLFKNPQLQNVEFNGYYMNIFVLSKLPALLPNCHQLKFKHCYAFPKFTLPTWQQFNSLRSIHFDWNNGMSENIIESLVDVPLQALSLAFSEYYEDDIYKIALESLPRLKSLEMITFRTDLRGDLDRIDVYELTQKLANLSTIIFDDYGTVKEIKRVFQQLVQPLKLTIQFQPSAIFFKITKEDCDDINNLLCARPETKLTVTLCECPIFAFRCVSDFLLKYNKFGFILYSSLEILTIHQDFWIMFTDFE